MLASGGVRFDQALSPTPLTLPSHASLFTGLVPRRHGVRNNALWVNGKQMVDTKPATLKAALLAASKNPEQEKRDKK